MTPLSQWIDRPPVLFGFLALAGACGACIWAGWPG